MTLQPQVMGSSTLKALLEDPSLKNPPVIGLINDQLKVKKEDVSDLPQFNYGSAFLGPNLWDRSLDSSNFNLEYMDLDEFLSENGINSDEASHELQTDGRKAEDSSCVINVPASPCQFPLSPRQYLKVSTPNSPDEYHTPTQFNNIASPHISFTVDFQVNEQDLALTSIPGEPGFDPRMRNFSEEELKPQPVIKKSRKIFVPEEFKDEKYWSRRHKNNFAARRSRDARRVKENQISMRAAFLEKENSCLREEMTRLRKENARLTAKVSEYEGTLPEAIELPLLQ